MMLGDADFVSGYPHRFFVTGVGRSGTKSVAALFNRLPNVVCFHEPAEGPDMRALVRARMSESEAEEYLRLYREPFILANARMYEYEKGYRVHTIGECNSMLRFHAPALRKVYPGVPIMQLVRDGRDVVRSLMARHHYQDGCKGAHYLAPFEDDPWFEEWGALTRFEKLCWYWQDGVTRLLDLGLPIVQLRRISSDFEFFTEKLAKFVGVEVPQPEWRRQMNHRSNATTRHVFPAWRDWDAETTRSFWRICEPAMVRAGYQGSQP